MSKKWDADQGIYDPAARYGLELCNGDIIGGAPHDAEECEGHQDPNEQCFKIKRLRGREDLIDKED